MRKNNQIKVPVEPVEYTIGYPWGALQVSETADESYGLVPLTPDVVMGDTEVTSTLEGFTPIRLVLLSPDEFVSRDHADLHLTNFGAFQIDRQKHETIATTTLGVDEEELKTGIIEQLHEFSDSIGVPTDEITDEDGVPAEQVLEADAGQILAHGLSLLGSEVIKVTLLEQMQEESRKRIVRAQDFSMANIIIAPGIIVGINALANTVSISTAGIAGALAGVNAILARKRLKIMMDNLPRHEAISEHTAMTMGAIAASDIHDSYCRHVFDSQFDQDQLE